MESKNCKRVVIIGNGGSTLSNKNGQFIDQSEIVIRLKNFVLNGFEEYVGTKTDIWCTKWFSFLESPNQNIKATLWLPFVDPNETIECTRLNKINKNLFTTSFPDKSSNILLHNQLCSNKTVVMLSLDELQESLELLTITDKLFYMNKALTIIHPTTFFYSIFLAAKRYPNYKIYVTGCDGFSQGLYWNLNFWTEEKIKLKNKKWPHYYPLESLYIKKLVTNNQVVLI